MRILHLIDSGGLYGAEKMLLALVSEQVKLGLQPMIISAGAPDVEEKALETEARRLGLPIMPWRMKPGFNLYGAMAIIRWARAEQYDVFHSHGYKFNVLIGIWPAFVRKIPLVTTLHGYLKSKKFGKAWVYETLDRFALRRINGVVLVAHAMKRDIAKSISSSEKVSVIANGLDVERLEDEAKRSVPSHLSDIVDRHRPLLLAVGRLSREKGFDRLIGALKTVKHTYPDSGLIIIGEGRCRGELEQQVVELDLANTVYLPGYCETVPALMARSDLLCMPSRTEGLPITLLEAMSVGVPVCASDVGEIRTVLGNGKGGVVSGVGSADQLAADILRGLAEKKEMAESGEWAKSQVVQMFSASTMAQKYVDVYKGALERSAS